jgi:hypothetical protein
VLAGADQCLCVPPGLDHGSGPIRASSTVDTFEDLHACGWTRLAHPHPPAAHFAAGQGRSHRRLGTVAPARPRAVRAARQPVRRPRLTVDQSRAAEPLCTQRAKGKTRRQFRRASDALLAEIGEDRRFPTPAVLLAVAGLGVMLANHIAGDQTAAAGGHGRASGAIDVTVSGEPCRRASMDAGTVGWAGR